MPMPHGLNALDEFIYSIILSNKVEGSRPLSTLLIGMPDTGRTESLMQYATIKKTYVMTDMTGYGLSQLLPKMQSKEILTIIIPDLSRITEGRGKATEGLIAAMNSLIEEGVLNVSTFNTKFISDKPVNCNILAALTISTFTKGKKSWQNLGFLSRVIPFFLGYCEEDIEKALRTIKEGHNPFKPVTNIDISEKISVQCSSEMKDKIEKFSKYLAKVNSDYTAFRTYKNLVTLAKSHAILKKRDAVNLDDIKFIKSLLPFWYAPKDSSFFGNDAEYYILQNLPASDPMLIEKLNFQYSTATIEKSILRLQAKKIISKDKSTGYYFTEVD